MKKGQKKSHFPYQPAAINKEKPRGQEGLAVDFADKRPAAIAQRKRQTLADNSPQIRQSKPQPGATIQNQQIADIPETQSAGENTNSGQEPTPKAAVYASNIVQRVKGWNLTLGVIGTIFTVGLIWLSPGFRKFMKKAWHDDEYREKLLENDFRITAGLGDYRSAFGSGFSQKIAELGKEERWLDGGAGVGQAIADYYEEGGLAKTTAIGFEKPEHETTEDLEKRKGQFNYLSGKFFSEFDEERELETRETKLSVITDYNGILSYTRTLSQDLQKYLNNLKVGGTLYTFFYATINNGAVTEFEWLNRIEGVTVTQTKGGFQIVKDEAVVEVPELTLVKHEHTKTANIPNRSFTL